MDFFDAVKKRRSVCEFSNKPVAHKDIVTMVKTAILAPSATNEQPWRFIVVQDKELKEGMREVVNAMVETIIAAAVNRSHKEHLAWMRSYSTHFADAPVAIAVLARPWVGGKHSTAADPAHHDLALMSVAMAVNNLQLAATALGYSSCFASSPAEFARGELEALLQVSQPWFLVGMISLGIAARQPERRPRRKPIEKVCTFIG